MRCLVLAVAVLAAAGCSSIKSTTTCASPGDVSSRQTYSWVSSEEGMEKAPALKRIRATVDRLLADKGFRRIESGTPDMQLELLLGARLNETYTGNEQRDMVSAAWWNWGTGMGTGFTAQTSSYKSYADAGIGVLASEVGGKRELWRGITKFRLNFETFDPAPIEKAVESMVDSRFPKHKPKA